MTLEVGFHGIMCLRETVGVIVYTSSKHFINIFNVLRIALDAIFLFLTALLFHWFLNCVNSLQVITLLLRSLSYQLSVAELFQDLYRIVNVSLESWYLIFVLRWPQAIAVKKAHLIKYST